MQIVRLPSALFMVLPGYSIFFLQITLLVFAGALPKEDSASSRPLNQRRPPRFAESQTGHYYPGYDETNRGPPKKGITNLHNTKKERRRDATQTPGWLPNSC